MPRVTAPECVQRVKFGSFVKPVSIKITLVLVKPLILINFDSEQFTSRCEKIMSSSPFGHASETTQVPQTSVF